MLRAAAAVIVGCVSAIGAVHADPAAAQTSVTIDCVATQHQLDGLRRDDARLQFAIAAAQLRIVDLRNHHKNGTANRLARKVSSAQVLELIVAARADDVARRVGQQCSSDQGGRN